MATPRIPLESPTVEVGAPLSLVGWGALAEVLGAAPRSQDVSPSAQGPMGHSPPLCTLRVHFLGLFAIYHLTPLLFPGSATGNPGRLPGSRRPSTQSPGHKYSAQALLAICPTGEGATALPSAQKGRQLKVGGS